MKWGKGSGPGPRGYHHGDLKEALVRAALALIAEKGPAGFTFADAARWAGVSPAALTRPAKGIVIAPLGSTRAFICTLG